MVSIISQVWDFFKLELLHICEPRDFQSTPLSILITLFMIYSGFHLWKILLGSNEIILLKRTAKFRFLNVARQFHFFRGAHLAPTSLYFNEKFLRVCKLANRQGDSKAVVDRATKRPLDKVLAALKTLNESNLEDIKAFIEENLHEPGYEIESAHFADWESRPRFVDNLENKQLVEFSLALNRIWLDLYKKFNKSKLDSGCVSSFLDMRHPFVVPGGRFIEIYYWDTYWTIEGLLVCGMLQTARQMIENFIDFIKIYGFIPNGSRLYYLNRSQPPYFSQMVSKFYEFCMISPELETEAKLDYERFVLDQALPAMIQEHAFWMSERTVMVNNFKLNLYKVNTTQPRPESYFEDIETSSFVNNTKDREQLYCDIAAAAESGYDFSSRWFSDSMKLKSISTSKIVPVDLNSVMYRNELIIAEMCFRKGDYYTGDHFKQMAESRQQAINKVLWCQESLCWSDYNLAKKELNRNFYVTNLTPLWLGILPPNISSSAIIDKHSAFLRSFDGGVPVSSINNGQQWDFPNVWAPNQYQLVHGLMRHRHTELALSIARRFYQSVYSGWLRTGNIYEKYSAVYSGERGFGGEYEVQSGFGWTNGVILSFIRTFRDEIVEHAH